MSYLKSITSFVSLICFLLFLTTSSAKADVFVWKDPEFNIDLVYPDDWRVQFNAHPDLKLHILAPQGRDFAACKVNVKRDARYKVYPIKYTTRINSIVFNAENIREHFVEEDYPSVIARNDFAAIGKADAVYAEVRYVGRQQGVSVPMQALVFATLYGDMNFVFECEAAAQNWAYWKPIFMNIAKSVDFPLAQDMLPHGRYPHDFLNEGDILLSTDNAKTGTLRY
jgi:hypothetical protein